MSGQPQVPEARALPPVPSTSTQRVSAGPRDVSLLMLKGVRRLPKLAACLAKASLPLSVRNMTLPSQRMIPSKLDGTVGRVAALAPQGLAHLLIGEAVALGHRRSAEENELDAA